MCVLSNQTKSSRHVSGLQTANLEQYLQKFNREPKYNSDFASLQFGNQNLEQKKQQLQEQFAREAELEKYKKLELEKIQELNRLERYRQFEKNLRQFEQTESSASTIPQLNSRPQEIQPFTPSFSPLVNFDNLPQSTSRRVSTSSIPNTNRRSLASPPLSLAFQ